jgi:hypothetical protein
LTRGPPEGRSAAGFSPRPEQAARR